MMFQEVLTAWEEWIKFHENDIKKKVCEVFGSTKYLDINGNCFTHTDGIIAYARPQGNQVVDTAPGLSELRGLQNVLKAFKEGVREVRNDAIRKALKDVEEKVVTFTLNGVTEVWVNEEGIWNSAELKCLDSL